MVGGESQIATHPLALTGEEHFVIVGLVFTKQPAKRSNESSDTDEESDDPSNLCGDNRLVWSLRHVLVVGIHPQLCGNEIHDDGGDNAHHDACPHTESAHEAATGRMLGVSGALGNNLSVSHGLFLRLDLVDVEWHKHPWRSALILNPLVKVRRGHHSTRCLHVRVVQTAKLGTSNIENAERIGGG